LSPSCGGESLMVTRRLRLLVSSVLAAIRYIGMSQSKSAGPASLQNENVCRESEEVNDE
jgi:hypothetical protein